MKTKIKVAVIAGTTEGKKIIESLGKDDNFEIWAFSATKAGEEILKDLNCKKITGRLDAKGFLKELEPFEIVVDATHPFAQEVTKNVKNACDKLNIKYLRYSRKFEKYNYKNILYFDSKKDVAKYLNKVSGNILFTTGTNTLKYYSENVMDFKTRSVARVLDLEESRVKTSDISGILIYSNPPFKKSDNLKIINKYNIKYLVSKDSAAVGGLFEKIEAAKAAGITVLIIKRPFEADMLDFENVMEVIKTYKK